jgi:hypothetical protein
MTWNGLACNTCDINVFMMQRNYVKISCKEDVHIYCTNFAKRWNEICMKQLASGKCMGNNCFLKLEMLQANIN